MTVFTILIVSSLILYVGVVLWAYLGWKKIAEFQSYPFICKTKVSIMVPLRNEAENVERLVSSLLAQDYPKELTEIILIDDHSTDTTLHLLRKYEAVKIIELQTGHGKKAALTEGIQHARGKLILSTDADCIHPTQWVSTIVDSYQQKQWKFMAGPVKMMEKNNLLTKVQQLDLLAMQGFTAAGFSKKPFLCNGANVAYEKEIFEQVNGFEGVNDLASGDDVLFMQKVYEKYPRGVFFLKSRQGIVTTQAEKSVQSLFQQRIRWGSKLRAKMLPQAKWIVMLLSVYYLFLLANFILAIYSPYFISLLIISCSLKCIIDFWFIRSLTRFYGMRELLWLFLPLQLLYIGFILFVGLAGSKKQYVWKQRTWT